jgi:hypothetical protein
MRLASSAFSTLGPGLLAVALSACSLEAVDAVIESCAACGEVRSTEPRAMRADIRLDTSVPHAYSPSPADTATQPLVYHVRVQMDRGGSRDFMLARADLQVGDRVEISGSEPVVRDAAARYRWM